MSLISQTLKVVVFHDLSYRIEVNSERIEWQFLSNSLRHEVTHYHDNLRAHHFKSFKK